MRIHLELEDLTRVRMVESASPVLESIFALQMLSGPTNPVFRDWRRQAEVAVGRRLNDVTELLRRHQPVPDLLWLADRETKIPAHGYFAHQGARQRAVPVVFDFCRLAVLPYWSSLRRYLQSYREARGQHVIQRGVDSLLRTLHPLLSWEPPVLTIPDGRDRDVYLSGRGLSFKMSLFLGTTPGLVMDPDAGGSVQLVVPVPVTGETASVLRAPSEDEEGALGALVGHTRAAALQVMADGCTTGELSDRLGISLAGASKHAKVLRKAGLIVTARNGNSSLHSLSSLGLALLKAVTTRASKPRSTDEGRLDGALDIGSALSGGRRESHPPAPTDPGVNLSAHRALVILITRRWRAR
ncbi:helix-turn-helix transcriptional regulator [Plantactinospora sp. KBS50]|uniref:ArsR/SmtB family transcription factor n=1 Tax=Plantactinospora sp. KBS50 TaxID=2024580 RepID=UPI0012FDEB17|nr:winged helix-turn-helix domain-containing protein [Plantactinospora sp. KBS50]